jgi:hypothetical protein
MSEIFSYYDHYHMLNSYCNAGKNSLIHFVNANSSHSLEYICITANPTGNIINLPVAQVDAVRWLENNDEPREEVITRWTATYSHRLNAIESLGIQGYFERFKAIQRSDGYILVSNFFSIIYDL